MSRALVVGGVLGVVALMLLVVAEQQRLVEQQQHLWSLSRRRGVQVRTRVRLRLEREALARPQRVAAEARRLGMRPAARRVFVDLAAWERGRRAVAVSAGVPSFRIHGRVRL